MTKQYIVLAVLLVLWCSLHSFLISLTVTRYLKSKLGELYRYYRLFYNAITILTLLPVGWYMYSIQSQSLFLRNGYLLICRVILLALSVFLFRVGAQRYDLHQFLGIRQIKSGISSNVLTGSGELDTNGILGVIRHPWYAGGILLIWARTLTVTALITNVVFTVYLVIGAYLEERKLVLEFGEQYREYQRNVSMLIPFKWLRTKIKR